MPKIDEIAFARLVSAGKVYRNTCLVFEKEIDAKWWRKDGMAFSPGDFDSVIARKPQIVVLGTGLMNKVSVLDETLKRLAAAGIETITLDTKTAVDKYNELLKQGKNVVGAFHLM
jgi:hypothetical protein